MDMVRPDRFAADFCAGLGNEQNYSRSKFLQESPGMILGLRRTKTILIIIAILFVSKTQLNAQKQDFSAIDGIIEGGIAAKKFPGAVVIVGHNGRVVFHKAYGNRSLIPEAEPMTKD